VVEQVPLEVLGLLLARPEPLAAQVNRPLFLARP
jgi:hypothetical protein